MASLKKLNSERLTVRSVHPNRTVSLIEPPTPQETPIPSVGRVWIFSGIAQYKKVCLLPDELVGVVAMVAGIPVSRVPVTAVTLKSPKSLFLAAFRSIESTLLSLTVELNFKARSTMTLPHLGITVVK